MNPDSELGSELLDAMIKDEHEASPAYDKLADQLAPLVDTIDKSRFIRLILAEHARDEMKHEDGLIKLKEIIF